MEVARLRSRNRDLWLGSSRLCCRAFAKGPAACGFRALRIYAQPFVSRKRSACGWILGGEPFLGFSLAVGRLSRDFLSHGHPARAGRAQASIRLGLRGICLARSCVLAAAHTDNHIGGTIFLAALQKESRVRSFHWPRRGDGHLVLVDDVARVGRAADRAVEIQILYCELAVVMGKFPCERLCSRASSRNVRTFSVAPSVLAVIAPSRSVR